MKFSSVTLVSAALLAIAALSSTTTDAHSWLVKPVSRENSASGADTTNTRGCPSMNPGKSTSFKAGETIDVRYWRNNHLGGFIRWSIVPKGQENSKEKLDSSAFHYSCRESGPECLPKGNQANNMYAGDGVGDTSNVIACGDKITLPDWLPAGDYVLQWTWFGVGSSFGNIGWAEPQFRSCADIKLTTKGSKSSAPNCPTFTGGDRVTKMKNQGNDKCFYFYTTDIVNSVYKGSNTDYASKYKYGIPAPIEKCRGSSGPSAPVVTQKPVTQKPSSPASNQPPATRKPATQTPPPPGTVAPPGGNNGGGKFCTVRPEPGMQEWCTANCSAGFCPPSHCKAC
ncbi:hypothetical protein PybrP1_010588 [[Pythium] brassicae (nom. inval.)]|nr:hypothetical protein PybrP1_010588 [[Pythium] brassicae (nom. inval.)]